MPDKSFKNFSKMGNMDTNKKFEDQLRERLHGEELPFDPAGWDSFQEQYPQEPASSLPAKKRRKRWLFLLCFLLAGAIAAFFGQHTTQETAGPMGDIPIVADDLVEKRNVEKLDQKQQKVTAGATGEQQVSLGEYSAPADIKSKQLIGYVTKEPVGQYSIREAAKEASDRLNEKESSSSQSEMSTGRGLFGTNDKPAATNIVGTLPSQTGGTSQGATTGRTAEMVTQALSEERVVTGQTLIPTSVKIDKGAGKVAVATEKAIEPYRELLTIGGIPPWRSVAVEDLSTFDYSAQQAIVPYRFKRNELLLGIGYAYRPSMTAEGIRSAGIDGTERNYFQLLYERRLDQKWSLGTGVAVYVLPSVGVEKITRDYHLTSTSFEFIEATTRHKRSAYLEVPLYLKYNPLGKRYAVFAGVKGGYALAHDVVVSFSANGSNEVIEMVSADRSYDQYMSTYDFGLIVGGRYRIWKNLELEARFSYGLTDITDNIFWGESYDRTTSVSAGINYTFNW